MQRSFIKQKLLSLRGFSDYIIQRLSPRIWFEIMYKRAYGHRFDWSNPEDLTDKQRWIQFKTDISAWTQLADKYRVREYIKEKGLDELLVPLLGKWEKADEIDFDKLPNQFVLKTNHGYGEIIIVKDKKSVDVELLRSKIYQFVNTPFGYVRAETHYLKIKPCIIAEKLLIQDGKIKTKSLIDFKFFTFHGTPKYCAVFYDRDISTHKAKCQLFNMEWQLIDSPKDSDVVIPRPVTFEKMINACHVLSSQFPFVRMDFYEVSGRLYFGEFTFTPAGLGKRSEVFNPQRLKEWGKYMDLSIYENYQKK